MNTEILIIEDNPVIRKELQTVLREINITPLLLKIFLM